MQYITKKIVEEVQRLQLEKGIVFLAIDGRCASGKTTLANALLKQIDCNVIPIDHFFLRPEQRTKERYEEVGGNVDRERFLEEVLLPLNQKKRFVYRPYDCHIQAFGTPIVIHPKRINIIEGSYCCHPKLRKFYDFTVFLTVGEEEQMRRIERRNGEKEAKIFQEKWIPLEEKYFATYHISEQCDLCFDTNIV